MVGWLGVSGAPQVLGGGRFPREPAPLSSLGVRKWACSIASHDQWGRFSVGGNSLGMLAKVFCTVHWMLSLQSFSLDCIYSPNGLPGLLICFQFLLWKITPVCSAMDRALPSSPGCFLTWSVAFLGVEAEHLYASQLHEWQLPPSFLAVVSVDLCLSVGNCAVNPFLLKCMLF